MYVCVLCIVLLSILKCKLIIQYIAVSFSCMAKHFLIKKIFTVVYMLSHHTQKTITMRNTCSTNPFKYKLLQKLYLTKSGGSITPQNKHICVYYLINARIKVNA